MNRYLLTLLSGIFSFAANAQYQYNPMPLTNGEWTYRMISEYQNGYVAWDYMLIGTNTDTLIAGKTYKKILRREHRYDGIRPVNYPLDARVATSPDFSYAFMREDNKRVYSYTWDNYSQVYLDTVIYDFNLGVGDTMPTYFNVYPVQTPFLYVIRTIDTVNMGGSLRKRFKAESITVLTHDTITVIEGIGSDRGLIMNNVSGPYGQYTLTLAFYCFRIPGSFEYNPKNDPCYAVWLYGTPTTIGNTSNEKLVSIYPNPFTDAVSIDFKQDGNVVLYNAMGAVVAKQSISTGRNTINTSALSIGVYFMVLKDEKGYTIHSRQLIKR